MTTIELSYYLSIFTNILTLAMYITTNGFVFKYIHIRKIGILAGFLSLFVPFATIYWLNILEERIAKTTDFDSALELFKLLNKGGKWERMYGVDFLNYNGKYYAVKKDRKILGAPIKVLEYLLDVNERRNYNVTD